jgi:hypothetical protein
MGSGHTSIQCVLREIQLDQGRQATYSLCQLARINPAAAAGTYCKHCQQQNTSAHLVTDSQATKQPKRVHVDISSCKHVQRLQWQNCKQLVDCSCYQTNLPTPCRWSPVRFVIPRKPARLTSMYSRRFRMLRLSSREQR